MIQKGSYYRWIVVGKGEIPYAKVPRTARQIAAELEADYLKEHGCHPTGFRLKGGGVGTIEAPGA